MVVWFNKWLLATLFAFPLLAGQAPKSPHPLHLGMVEIEHNREAGTLEVSCKLFTDDFENILERTFNVNIDLINPPDRAFVQKYVNEYVKKHLQIKVDGKQAEFSCIGFERDHEATFSYFEAQGINSANSFEITVDLMYDLFDDQSNIIHLIKDGKRKSSKLNYPAKMVKQM